MGVSLHQGVFYHLQHSLTLCKLTIYQVYQREQRKLFINTIATVFLSMKISSVFCKSVTTKQIFGGFQNLQNHPSIHLQYALLRQTLAPRWAQTAHSQAHLFPQVWKTTICGSALTAHKLWAIIYCATYLATILKLLYKAPETQSRKILRPKISQKRLRTQKTPLLTMLRKKEKFQQCENSLTDLNNFFIEVNIKLL